VTLRLLRMMSGIERNGNLELSCNFQRAKTGLSEVRSYERDRVFLREPYTSCIQAPEFRPRRTAAAVTRLQIQDEAEEDEHD
jgi:hypothetical protein